MIALAADSDLSSNERIIYPILVYLLSWGFLLAGIYLAGPEIVNKIKYYYNLVKSKFSVLVIICSICELFRKR